MRSLCPCKTEIKTAITLGHIPHPIHNSSDIEAILELAVTSIHNLPVKDGNIKL